MSRQKWYFPKLFFAALVELALIFVTVTAALSFAWAQPYLHPMPPRVYATGGLLTSRGIPFQPITLTTEDGLTLSGWYTPPQNGAVILVAHGYGSQRDEVFHALFAEHGYGALSWDFRAHGKSSGRFSSLGYYETRDVKAALDYARAQPDVKQVGAWGGSMGATTVLLAAAKYHGIEAVVSDSAYPTLEDVMKLNLFIEFMQPFVLFSWEFSSGVDMNQVRAVDEIGKISPRAVFVIDGWYGAAVAMDSPNRLYDAANEPKQIWVENGVPHLGMYAAHPEQYTQRVIEFFNAYLSVK